MQHCIMLLCQLNMQLLVCLALWCYFVVSVVGLCPRLFAVLSYFQLSAFLQLHFFVFGSPLVIRN